MRKYEFGSCIPEAIKIYNRLKRAGKSPVFFEGWAEVKDLDDVLEPNEEFLTLYYGKKMLRDIKKGSDYPRVLQHTFIICDGKIIDKTINQFDKFGGVICYYEKCRYWFRGRVDVDMQDIEIGAGAEFEENKRILYPEKNYSTIYPEKLKKEFYKKVVSYCRTRK